MIATARSDLDDGFRRVEAIPVVEDGSIHLDVDAYIDRFEYDELLGIAADVTDILDDEIRREVDEESRIDALETAATVLELLVDQRRYLYEAVAAGDVFVRRYLEDDPESAAAAAADGRILLEGLSETVVGLEDALPSDADASAVDTYQPTEIAADLAVIDAFLVWAEHAYKGFDAYGSVMLAVEEATVALGRENFESAVEAFETAHEWVGEAEASFDRALVSGRRFEPFAEFVDHLRCTLRFLLPFTEEMQEIIETFDHDPKEAQRRIDDVLLELERILLQCEESAQCSGKRATGSPDLAVSLHGNPDT